MSRRNTAPEGRKIDRDRSYAPPGLIPFSHATQRSRAGLHSFAPPALNNRIDPSSQSAATATRSISIEDWLRCRVKNIRVSPDARSCGRARRGRDPFRHNHELHLHGGVFRQLLHAARLGHVYDPGASPCTTISGVLTFARCVSGCRCGADMNSAAASQLGKVSLKGDVSGRSSFSPFTYSSGS